MNKNEKVRDGYFQDLPEDIQKKIMNIHRLIVDTAYETLKDHNYTDLKNDKWAKNCLDEFLLEPTPNDDVGSVRVYQKGKKYRCMIQLTGHFANHMNDFNQELMHDFIKNIFVTIRPIIRRKYDCTITNEGDHGQPFEGFDLFTKPKVAEEIWNKFEDFKTRAIKESEEVFDYDEIISFEESNDFDDFDLEEFDEKSHGSLKFDFRRVYDVHTGHLCKIVFSLDNIDVKTLGHGATNFMAGENIENGSDEWNKIHSKNIDFVRKNIKKLGNPDHVSSNQKVLAIVDLVTNEKLNKVDGIGEYGPGVCVKFTSQDEDWVTWVTKKKRENPEWYKHHVTTYEVGKITPNALFKSSFFPKNPINKINGRSYTSAIGQSQETLLTARGAKMHDIDRNWAKQQYVPGKSVPKYNHPSKKDIKQHPELYKKESVDVSNLMSEKQVIGTIAGMNIGEMNQSKANTIANLITKNMLPRWAPSFNKFTIVVDTKSEGSIVEFKVPKMTQDFISRFLENRETIDGFLHRSPEIKIRVTAKAFSTVKEPANILHFMKAAIKYYDSKIDGYANKLMIETRKLGHKMNHLISTTKLSGLVSFPLSLLFVFDKVDMTNKDTFNLSASDTEAINAFIHNIHSRYPAPEKEKKEIINALQTMISHLRESVNFDENYDDLIHLSSEVEKYLSEGYKNEIEVSDIIWISENVDNEWTYHQEDPQIKALIEANHVKKLKKIPRDLVAYIQIETESIEDANDKMLIASYCIDKLEIVEWYIELLEVGSEKYIVPDSLSYLRTVRTQLIQCYKNIMAVKVTPKSQRPLYDINVLPAGYRD